MQPATWDEHAKPPAQDTALHLCLMQPEAELYSITITNSSSTRNLKGGGSTGAPGSRSDAGGRTRHTVVAIGCACQPDVSRETRIRDTTRAFLMRGPPDTQGERESDRVLLCPV